MQDELIKGGKRAQIGELRTFGGRQYIKTADGWKFHGKGTGTKTKQHIENTKQHNSNHTNEQSSSTKQDVKTQSSKQSKSTDDTNRRIKHLYDVQKMFSSPENRHMNNVPDNQKKNFIDGLVRSQGGSKKDVEDIHNHLKSTGKYDEYKNKVNSTLTDDEKKTIKHFVDNGQSNVLDEVAIKNIMKKGVSKQTIDSYIDSLKSTNKSTKTSSDKKDGKQSSKVKSSDSFDEKFDKQFSFDKVVGSKVKQFKDNSEVKRYINDNIDNKANKLLDKYYDEIYSSSNRHDNLKRFKQYKQKYLELFNSIDLSKIGYKQDGGLKLNHLGPQTSNGSKGLGGTLYISKTPSQTLYMIKQLSSKFNVRLLDIGTDNTVLMLKLVPKQI